MPILYGQTSVSKDSSSSVPINKTVESSLIKRRNQLIKEGYVFTSIDSGFSNQDSKFSWVLMPGQRFDSLILVVSFGNDRSEIFLIRNNTFLKLEQKLDELINREIQKGYLKAYYQFDTIAQENKTIRIKYDLILNKHFVIDSIRIFRTSNSLNIQFIQNYIKRYFKDKRDFDWKSIVSQLRYFDFIELEKNPDFTILDSTAIINLYLKERKLNQVNAILGILSNAYSTGGVDLTGDVKLSLINLFKRGVTFQLNWQKNLDNSQFLYSKVNMPFILNTKLGMSGMFNIEKFDTSFLRVQYQLGLNYNIQSNQVLSFYYRKNISTIVGFNQSEIFNGRLPSYLDFSTNEVGFGYRFFKLNKPLFPRKGWSLDVNFLAGSKSIFINSRIAELRDTKGESMAKLYKTIPLSQLTLSTMLDITKYSTIGKDFVLKTRLDSKSWISETLSTGEMYYIGGNKLPRGFDDNSFITPWYITFSNEVQYYLSEYFYSNIFVDISTMKNRLDAKIISPIGVGGGISLKASDNIFRMEFGTGYLGESKFSLSNMKVHLNYVSIF